MEKVDVNGAHAHPVFLFLKQSCEGVSIRWNFGAYFLVLARRQGRGRSNTSPAALTERVGAARVVGGGGGGGFRPRPFLEPNAPVRRRALFGLASRRRRARA